MAKDKTEKAAMTLRLPSDLNDWIVNEAHEFGIGKNAMIVMLLQKARQSSSAVSVDG